MYKQHATSHINALLISPSFRSTCGTSVAKEVDLHIHWKMHVFSLCGRDPIYFISNSLQKLVMQVNNLASSGRF